MAPPSRSRQAAIANSDMRLWASGGQRAATVAAVEVLPAPRADPPLAAVAPAEIENLRYGLNAIARWLR